MCREPSALKIAAIFFLAGLAACTRSSTQATTDASSPNPVNSAAVLDAGNSANAAIDASLATREDCAEPKKLTQLVTVNESARFNIETLEGTAHNFDPETAAPSELGPKPIAKAPPNTPSRYAQVAGGWGLIWKDQEDTAKVEDVATRKKVMDFAPCT